MISLGNSTETQKNEMLESNIRMWWIESVIASSKPTHERASIPKLNARSAEPSDAYEYDFLKNEPVSDRTSFRFFKNNATATTTPKRTIIRDNNSI